MQAFVPVSAALMAVSACGKRVPLPSTERDTAVNFLIWPPDGLVKSESSDRSTVDAIAWQRAGGLTLWLANLTGDRQRVALTGLPSGPAIVRVLDEGSYGPASLDPRFFAARGERLGRGGAVDLGPYAVACVDLTSA